jgi:hypothetical protein
LPSGSLNYFTLCRVGKYAGLRILCPVCGTYPKAVKPWQRWRWMAAHIHTAHPYR